MFGTPESKPKKHHHKKHKPSKKVEIPVQKAPTPPTPSSPRVKLSKKPLPKVVKVVSSENYKKSAVNKLKRRNKKDTKKIKELFRSGKHHLKKSITKKASKKAALKAFKSPYHKSLARPLVI